MKRTLLLSCWAALVPFALSAQETVDGSGQTAPTDMTYLLTNPDFEQSAQGEQQTVGWTIDAQPGGNVRTGGVSTNTCYEA
ncbi:MAG: hypothetical protein IJ570_06685 [Prevotella sp.]|nr:hypothetical protein [Prevotella sp.]